MRYLVAFLAALIPVTCGQSHASYDSELEFLKAKAIAEQAKREQEEKCLATMVYGEARGEKETGMIAVAYSAINRAKNKSVCEVVLAPKQYSIFNNNPTLREAAMSIDVEPEQKNDIDNTGWEKARQVAAQVMRKQVADPTAGATHYLAPAVMAKKGYKYPRWSREYALVAVIDNHKFYKQQKVKKA